MPNGCGCCKSGAGIPGGRRRTPAKNPEAIDIKAPLGRRDTGKREIREIPGLEIQIRVMAAAERLGKMVGQ